MSGPDGTHGSREYVWTHESSSAEAFLCCCSCDHVLVLECAVLCEASHDCSGTLSGSRGGGGGEFALGTSHGRADWRNKGMPGSTRSSREMRALKVKLFRSAARTRLNPQPPQGGVVC